MSTTTPPKLLPYFLSLFIGQDKQALISSVLPSEGVIQLLLIIALFVIVITVELIIGLYLRGFHLMMDSLHNILNILALVFSLTSTIAAKMPKNQRFTYGYSRLEIISSFANCCFLTFLSMFLVFRSIHDLLEALHEEGEHNHQTGPQRFDLLEVFNALRFLIHLGGLYALRRFSTLRPQVKAVSKEEMKKDDDAAKGNKASLYKSTLTASHYINFHTIYLHFVIGVLTTGVFVCFHFFEFLHHLNLEIVFAVAILVYTVVRTKPIFFLATDILLQGLPGPTDDIVDALLDKVKDTRGVDGISEAHYWALDLQNTIIYLNLDIMSQKVRPEIEREIKSILQGHFAEIMIDTTAKCFYEILCINTAKYPKSTTYVEKL